MDAFLYNCRGHNMHRGKYLKQENLLNSVHPSHAHSQFVMKEHLAENRCRFLESLEGSV